MLVGSAFTVDQKEQVFITEFGKPVRTINANPAKNEAGLHFKKPFIQKVNRIEKRILEWNGPAIEMSTRDKLYITVNNFARWRISDPQKYFENSRTNAARCPAWMTSSAAKPATSSPPTT